jgi:hypothetical protein
MNALRCGNNDPQAYFRKRQEEKAKREAEAQQEEDRLFEERRQAWLAEHEAEQAVRQYADSLSGTHTADPTLQSEPPVQPEPSQREKIIAAKKLKSKLSRAVKSKQAADAFNEKAAKAFAEKQVKRMEAQGKL